MGHIELKRICERVGVLATRVGTWIAAEGTRFSRESVEQKGPHDYVTYVDRGAEEQILSALTEILPEAGIISEEGGGKAVNDGLNWIVDPLDGTTNFIHGMPPHAVSIGLVDGKEPIMGVIYEIGLGELFHAVKGGGAYLGTQRIHCSNCARLEDALVATGFPVRDFTRLSEYVDLFKYLIERTQGVRRLGSAATDLAWLACGRIDAYYEYNLHAWDVAAGMAICREAGVRITDFVGDDNMLFGGSIVCAGEPLFDEFRGAVSSYMRMTQWGSIAMW